MANSCQNNIFLHMHFSLPLCSIAFPLFLSLPFLSFTSSLQPFSAAPPHGHCISVFRTKATKQMKNAARIKQQHKHCIPIKVKVRGTVTSIFRILQEMHAFYLPPSNNRLVILVSIGIALATTTTTTMVTTFGLYCFFNCIFIFILFSFISGNTAGN